MQISRLFEIVYLLLHKKNITAAELAEHFEVSVRTIYRDVDVLCQAGIPIFTSRGKNGGIQLLDQFILNKSLLSSEEQEEILMALEGLRATDYPAETDALSKLHLLFQKNSRSWIDIDFSGWKKQDPFRLQLLKKAILEKHPLSFDYYSTYGEKTFRVVEPVQLCFKGRTWYLNAFCRKADAMRVFKLSRIKNMACLEEHFSGEWTTVPEIKELHSPKIVEIELMIHPSLAYRVYDEFDPEDIRKNEDGFFLVTLRYPEDEWVYGYLFSFGCFAKVLSPPHIRKLFSERLQKMREFYSEI